jgi:hypothetical protein
MYLVSQGNKSNTEKIFAGQKNLSWYIQIFL